MTDLTFNSSEQPKMSAFNQRFGILNGLYQYWWRKFEIVPASYELSDPEVVGIATPGYAQDIEYSDSIVADSTSLKLVDPISVLEYSGRDYTLLNTIKNKFLHFGDSNVPTALKNAFCWRTNTDTNDDTEAEIQFVTYISSHKNFVGYVHSSDRDAYPDNGESGGYEYQFLGIPFDNAVEASKIVTGSYVGTGVYGSRNPPNTLEFHFKPLMVVVVADGPGMLKLGTVFIQGQARNQGIGTAYSSGSGLALTVSWSGNSVSWYDGDEDRQLNTSGVTYWYCAIG